MRILYRYNTLSCLLDLILQGKDVEDPTVINADYCTAPSIRSEYISQGLYYHGNYESYIGSLYNLLNRTESYSFSVYPELEAIFDNFMNNTPYRSVWVDSNCDGTKDALTSGNSVTIGKTLSFSENKTVIVGVMADNQFDVNYDGTIIVDGYAQGQTNFFYLHLFPVDVTAGTHYFSFTAVGDGSVNDALGVIIWDNTYADLITPIPRSSWNVLYSSEDSLTESLDIVTCPEGYSYDNESNLCVKIVDISAVTTQDYVLVTPNLACTGGYEIDTWTIDYGDGTSQSGSGAYPELFEHQYTSPDTYTITFTIVTTSGKTFSDTDTVTVDFEGCVEYGLLYNWYAANDSRNIANTGWRVPSHTDRDILVTYLGGVSVAGNKLREVGTTYWQSPNTGATNEVGFNARGAGQRGGNTGTFGNLKTTNLIWCNDQPWADNGYFLGIYYYMSGVQSSWMQPLTEGVSIRLVKDSTTLSHGETGTYTGNDGKVYRTICIGTQEWLADNLIETEYRNGDPIPIVEDGTTWAGLTTGAACAYDNDYNNVGCNFTL